LCACIYLDYKQYEFSWLSDKGRWKNGNYVCACTPGSPVLRAGGFTLDKDQVYVGYPNLVLIIITSATTNHIIYTIWFSILLFKKYFMPAAEVKYTRIDGLNNCTALLGGGY
jgi:hypothetical protein